MPPAGLETRHDFQVAEGVIGLGFTPSLSESAALEMLKDLVPRVEHLRGEKSPSFVVVDCREIRSLSAAAIGELIALQKDLGNVPWKLVLFGLDVGAREVFSANKLDAVFLLVADSDELQRVVGTVPGTPAPGNSQNVDGRLPPELVEWAQRTFNKEEFIAGLREVEETGGLELKDFIHELDSHPTLR